MNNKLLIYIVYDFEGIVDEYIVYMIKELQKFYSRIIIVANGGLKQKYCEYFQNLNFELIHRENEGFDGGAYKEIFLNYLSLDELSYFNEITLMNDSFYGPIFSMNSVFKIMESKDVDFWGITKFENGVWETGEIIPEHIQSYFITVRRSLFQSKCFKDFWRDYEESSSFNETVKNFEVRFTTFFSENGFKYAVLTDFLGKINGQDKSKNTWMEYADQLVKDLKIPFVKRKVFNVCNYKIATEVLGFIRDNTNYDENMIIKHIERLDKGGKFEGYSESRIKAFFNDHKAVYLYGNGLISQKLQFYLSQKGMDIKGIVITKGIDGQGVLNVANFVLEPGEGIIIATGKKYAEEIYSILKRKKISDSDIMRPI